MDDPAVEDDDYFDDDLDALPHHAFHELQQNALQSTQQPSHSAQVQLPSTKHCVGFASGPRQIPVKGLANHTANHPAFQPPSSDYGDFDEDMLDGEIFDAAEEPDLAARYKDGARAKEHGQYSPKEQWRLQRYGANERNSGLVEARQRVGQMAVVDVPLHDDTDLGGPKSTVQGRNAYLVEENPTGPPPRESADGNALQAQVQKVGLLKAQLYNFIRLYFCLASK